MAPLYSIRPVDTGWLVYDALNGQVLTLDGREQADLTLEQAESVVDHLNQKAIEQLISSAANDRDAPEGAS